MLIHTVFFWLKADTSEADRESFREALKALAAIPTVRQLYVGTPAAVPDRPVVDKSYDFGLTVLFDDVAGQTAYQEHPLHDAFVAGHARPLAEKVLVYDAD
ncbi:MAG: Dabb family protein [Opitutales bacterium]